MGKLPYGTPNRHVSASKGADTDIMKFYCTQNSTTYGRNWSKFEPRKGRHVGTGYHSNFRPGVYYSKRLDELDNPALGRIIAGNYMTMTQRDFRPYQGSNGTDALPSSLHQVDSGFVRQKPITNPTQRQVDSVFIDRRAATAPANILPKGQPLLHKLKGKDPVEQENGGYGPGFMTTETAEKFRGLPSNRMNSSRKAVGPNEDTGFTHAYNVEPITFQPGSPHKGDRPGYYTHRPTGQSVMKRDYIPYGFPNGSEPLPSIADRSERGTGFTRGTNAEPAYKNPNQKDGDWNTSVTMDDFKGKQRPDPSEAGRLARTSVGSKEPSGFCENNDVFVQTNDNPSRFITHYMTRFYDKTPYSKDREGHCRGNVQDQLPDGFTKSTYVHSYGPEINSTATLRRLEPYVARSIKATDPFYDDHTHDKKQVRFQEVAAS